MAVAVKQEPEATPRKPLNRLAVGSFLGIAYVLGSCALVFYALPEVWKPLAAQLGMNVFVTGSLLFLFGLVVAGGAVGLGLVLLHRNPVPGLRAGIFVGLLGLLGVGMLGSGLGTLLETRELDEMVGLVVTAVPTGALLLGLVWLFFRPGFDRWLERVEDQGWFHAAAYKGNQGVRVRRGTIVALLTLGGCGIYTLISHGGLPRSGDWELRIPFTTLTEGGVTSHLAVPLLPDARYTVPLVLLGLLLWVSWRIVNWPVFADFLIATEAEMNKVSWTTRKRLVQDTIVVLVTVFLLTLFLFVIDIVWIKLLSNPLASRENQTAIRVLVVDIATERQKLSEQAQW
jgi:preprotein translocase SecE subunit